MLTSFHDINAGNEPNATETLSYVLIYRKTKLNIKKTNKLQSYRPLNLIQEFSLARFLELIKTELWVCPENKLAREHIKRVNKLHQTVCAERGGFYPDFILVCCRFRGVYLLLAPTFIRL